MQSSIFRFWVYAAVAVGTYGLTGFLQAFFHQRFGHTPAGRALFHNHVKFHHSLYRKELTSPRYIDEERSNTAFYLVPIVVQSAITYPLLRRDIFLVFEASMILTYLAHIYVHIHFHLTNSWLQRFHWFLRLQRLHGVHHLDMSKNQAVLLPIWDRVLGTYQPAERPPSNRKTTPRGPRSSLVTGNLPDLLGDKLAFAVRCDRQIGSIVRLRLWNQPFFLVSDADMIGEILVTKHRNFTKPMPLKALSAAFGRGLVTAEHDLWVHQRKILQPAFHKSHLSHVARTAEACTRRMIEGWEDATTRDIYPAIGALCLEIFTKTMLGETLREDEQRAVTDCFALVQESNRSFTCLPKEHLPFPSTLRLRRACRNLDSVIADLVRRRGDGADGDDFLSLLLRARANGDTLATTRQIRDEVVTMFLTGYETVASGVIWALYLLSEHRAEASKLEEEVDAAIGFDADELHGLDYLGKIIKETHRLYPPVYQIGRVTIEPCEIGGHAIPANTHLLMYAWAVHRSPRYYEEPDAFRPQRWTSDMMRALPKFAYFPFGGGPRSCIGASLAMTETAAILATIAKNVRLSVPPGTRVVPDPALSLPIAGNSLPMIVRRRRPTERPSNRLLGNAPPAQCPFSKAV